LHRLPRTATLTKSMLSVRGVIGRVAEILAERLGFHQARAAQWVRAARATYADYGALRQAP